MYNETSFATSIWWLLSILVNNSNSPLSIKTSENEPSDLIDITLPFITGLLILLFEFVNLN